MLKCVGVYEVLTHLFHDLGIQSNILVSAKYIQGSSPITPAKLSAALLTVIHEHPALWIVGVRQPSEKQKGNHRLWEARLPHILFQDCVEFIDDDIDGNSGLSAIFKKAHNHWFDTADKSKPWWRLTVVNGTYVVFVYHHSIGDGKCGYSFHRSLIAALNANEVKRTVQSDDGADTFESPPPKELAPCPLDLIEDRLSWLHVIYNFLFWKLTRLFVNQKYFLFSDAIYPKTSPSVAKPYPIENRTVTNVEVLRIDQEVMAKCLVACRKHNTSFTAILHTLIQITLATDVYPKAKFGFSRQAVNIRPLLKFNPGPDVFMNAASDYGRVQWLGKYRKAGSNASSSLVQLDAHLTWKLASQYKASMSKSIAARKPLQDFLTGKLLGGDDEDFGTFYGLGLYQNNSFLMSNIGTFEPKEDMQDGGWSIQDVGFSAGAIRAALGDVGPSFNIASMKAGDCVISATYEDGVLRDEMVRDILDRVHKRLKLLL